MAEAEIPLDWPGTDAEWAAREQQVQHPTPDEAHDIGWSKGHIQGFREGVAQGVRDAARIAHELAGIIEGKVRAAFPDEVENIDLALCPFPECGYEDSDITHLALHLIVSVPSEIEWGVQYEGGRVIRMWSEANARAGVDAGNGHCRLVQRTVPAWQEVGE